MDDISTNPLYTDPQEQIQNNLHFDESVGVPTDPLALDIPDDDLIDIFDQRVKKSKKFFVEKYNIEERRKKLETYLFGRQIQDQEKTMKKYQTRSSDNALYEIEASLKPLAMSKLPDIIITPGGDDPDRVESAKNLTLVVDDFNKKRNQREVAGIGFKHLPVYLTAVVKAVWNPELGTDGDMEFVNINPEYIVIDETATSRDVKKMGFIAQCCPMSIQEVIMKFPSKRIEFLDEVRTRAMVDGADITWKDMATEVKVWEVHFDWYKRKDSKELLNKEEMNSMSILEPGIKWERVSGVMWKYEGCLLDKMLDPNFDHEGDTKTYTYTDPSDETTKQEVTPQQMLMASLTGQEIPNIKKEKVYHNYFKQSTKPYYFFGYDQWGKIAYDETSRIEQNVRNQENLDDQNRTILDQVKKRVKHIWSKDSGMDKAAVQRTDMDNPDLDALVEGDVNKVHKSIEPERPDAAQFNARGDTRDRMYAISGSTAVRGQQQSDVATTNQIAREADFTRSDDLVEDTINSFFEWMATWQMQFIILRYTSEHLKELVGPKGEMTYVRLKRDTAQDGMEVMIKTSSTDKLKAQRNAMQTAGLGAPFTNPLDFFRDMDMADPEGRTERGMVFALDPQGYFAKYVMGLQTPQQQAGALNGQLPPPQPGQPPVSVPLQGSQPPAPGQPPQQPSPMDTSNVPTAPPAPPQGPPAGL